MWAETLHTSRVPSLHGHYPASSLLRTPPSPARHPLAVRPLPRVSGYSLDMAPPLSRWGEEGFSICSTCPRHRAVALTPPERPAASARCDGPCCLRLSTVRLGLRGLSLSGPPVRLLPLRPGDSLTTLSMASSVGFRGSVVPPPCHPSYGALALTPAGLTPAEHVSSWSHVGSGTGAKLRRLPLAVSAVSSFVPV